MGGLKSCSPEVTLDVLLRNEISCQYTTGVYPGWSSIGTKVNRLYDYKYVCLDAAHSEQVLQAQGVE
jgi:hypothetical protein